MTDGQLEDLLTQARLHNTAMEVTGMLFYSPAGFAQVLEGERSVIEPLYAKIAADTRHENVTKLGDKAIAERSFGAWAMSYQPVSTAAFVALAGYLNPAQVPEQVDTLSMADTLLYQMMRDTLIPIGL